MDNYEFCVQWFLDQKLGSNSRVLDYDYGCGEGVLVKKLRKLDINSFGCDIFYEGMGVSALIENELFEGEIVKHIKSDNIIPFDSASFDVIINNQVMEHVEDLDIVLSEILRVLKPGCLLLSLFPHKGVWREGHCGVPFLHWFKKIATLEFIMLQSSDLWVLGIKRRTIANINCSILYNPNQEWLLEL